MIVIVVYMVLFGGKIIRTGDSNHVFIGVKLFEREHINILHLTEWIDFGYMC